MSESVGASLDLYFEQSDDAVSWKLDPGEVWVRLLALMADSALAQSSLVGMDSLIPGTRCSLICCWSNHCHSPGANTSWNRDNVYLPGFWDALAGLCASFRTGAHSRWPCSSVLSREGLPLKLWLHDSFWFPSHRVLRHSFRERMWFYILCQLVDTRSIVIYLTVFEKQTLRLKNVRNFSVVQILMCCV